MESGNKANKLLRWLVLGLPFPLIVLNGWLALGVFQYFRNLITILVAATLLAFILNYPVRFLKKRGLQRGSAVLLVILVALLSLVAFAFTLAPILLIQLNELAKLLPSWIDSGGQQLQALRNFAAAQNLPVNLGTLDTRLTEDLANDLEAFTGDIINLVLEAATSLSDVLIATVLAFYFLLDGNRLWSGVFQRFPPNVNALVQQSLQKSFQSYFIGQAALAVLVGFSMTLAFLVLRVPFGLLFGIGIGVVTLIPFGDVVSFSLVSLLVASHDFWLGVKVLAVAVVIDQVIDQIIAPRILGGFMGLRPAWILIALLVGASIGGVLGLFIAVPVAGSIKNFIDELDASKSDSPANVVE